MRVISLFLDPLFYIIYTTCLLLCGLSSSFMRSISGYQTMSVFVRMDLNAIKTQQDVTAQLYIYTIL